MGLLSLETPSGLHPVGGFTIDDGTNLLVCRIQSIQEHHFIPKLLATRSELTRSSIGLDLDPIIKPDQRIS